MASPRPLLLPLAAQLTPPDSSDVIDPNPGSSLLKTLKSNPLTARETGRRGIRGRDGDDDSDFDD